MIDTFAFPAIVLASALAAAPAMQHETVGAQIAHQFNSHALIMMGEWHRNAQEHVFLRELIRDPDFICRVDDIVIEFGNARLQNIADDYASGKDVSEADLVSMFRETNVPFTWNAPMYRQFYETVREVNEKHTCVHPVRLLLGDPPVDWSKVKTLKDFEAFEDRDGFFASVVESEVLAKRHHALLIAGVPHALRKLPHDAADEEPTVAQLIDRAHPHQLFSIALVTTPAAAKTLRMAAPPSFRVVHGAKLDGVDFSVIAPATSVTPTVVNGRHEWKLGGTETWGRMGDIVDGLVYLGGDETRVFPSPKIYLDPVYQQQLRARIAIIKEFNGQDFMPFLDDLVKEAQGDKSEAH